MDSILQKRCSTCKAPKPITSFFRSNRIRDGYQNQCKGCAKERLNRKWREDPNFRSKRLNYDRQRHQDPAKHEQWNAWRLNKLRTDKEFRSKHNFAHKQIKYRYRMRSKAAGDRFTQAEWRALCAKYNQCCLCCGTIKPLTPDHITPLSRGGSNSIENIQPLCFDCNRHKSSKTIDYRPGWEA